MKLRRDGDDGQGEIGGEQGRSVCGVSNAEYTDLLSESHCEESNSRITEIEDWRSLAHAGHRVHAAKHPP